MERAGKTSGLCGLDGGVSVAKRAAPQGSPSAHTHPRPQSSELLVKMVLMGLSPAVTTEGKGPEGGAGAGWVKSVLQSGLARAVQGPRGWGCLTQLRRLLVAGGGG